MMKAFDVRENLTEEEFVSEYVAKNTPVVISGVPFKADKWRPSALRNTIGEMTTQVYDTLFDLDKTSSLNEYMDENFGKDGPMPASVPYVRWYNQLKDLHFIRGDKAFEELSSIWEKPACIPTSDLVLPITGDGMTADPVSDNFPYRGILVAARGARTRMHRDPFFSDAIVAQFYGTKEAALYHPDRTEELTQMADDNSFGGFKDVRADDVTKLSVEPDYFGKLEPGQMIYIPHGWLHDVICTSDSISVTWNFIHKLGAAQYEEYLKNDPSKDSEFEVLQYFHKRGGLGKLSAEEMLDRLAA
jgi:hypothetical protein